MADLPHRTIDGEARVSCATLAAALGYSRAARLRDIVRRRSARLQELGAVAITPRPYRTGRGAVRMGEELWLNPAQATFLSVRRMGTGIESTLRLLGAEDR
jgi:hypothetical protein